MVYAVFRYVGFDTKYVENIPCFILNKAVGMAASFFLVCAFWNRCRSHLEDAGAYFRAAFTAVIVHIPLSLLLLRPGYFPEFFVKDGSKLKSWGEMMVLCGAVGLALLWQNSRDRFQPSGRQKLAVTLLAVIFCHVGAMGICRGVNINAKHAYLPPMWMLSLVVIGGGILALLWFARRGSAAKA